MIFRVLAFSSAVLGGAGASQFPEYSQQYLQRLSGAVEELDRVSADFDASAEAAGLNRDQALAQMEGTAFLESRRADMDRTFARHARLSEDLAALEESGPFARALHAWRMTDSDVAQAAWGDFEPAVPVTGEGAVFAGGGAVLGWFSLAGLWALLAWLGSKLFRRRQPSALAAFPSASDTPPADASRINLRAQASTRRLDNDKTKGKADGQAARNTPKH